jgi:hypothetical protein
MVSILNVEDEMDATREEVESACDSELMVCVPLALPVPSDRVSKIYRTGKASGTPPIQNLECAKRVRW